MKLVVLFLLFTGILIVISVQNDVSDKIQEYFAISKVLFVLVSMTIVVWCITTFFFFADTGSTLIILIYAISTLIAQYFCAKAISNVVLKKSLQNDNEKIVYGTNHVLTLLSIVVGSFLLLLKDWFMKTISLNFENISEFLLNVHVAWLWVSCTNWKLAFSRTIEVHEEEKSKLKTNQTDKKQDEQSN